MELTCLLAAVIFVEGKPHRRLVALSSRTLVLRSSVVNSVVEQIPGRSRNWPHVSDVWRHLPHRRDRLVLVSYGGAVRVGAASTRALALILRRRSGR